MHDTGELLAPAVRSNGAEVHISFPDMAHMAGTSSRLSCLGAERVRFGTFFLPLCNRANYEGLERVGVADMLVVFYLCNAVNSGMDQYRPPPHARSIIPELPW